MFSSSDFFLRIGFVSVIPFLTIPLEYSLIFKVVSAQVRCSTAIFFNGPKSLIIFSKTFGKIQFTSIICNKHFTQCNRFILAFHNIINITRSFSNTYKLNFFSHSFENGLFTNVIMTCRC